jgi:cysteine synthase A
MRDAAGAVRAGRGGGFDTGRLNRDYVCGAIRLARELGPGHTIVTILADSGTRSQSKLFNPAFLRERGLPTPPWLTK